MPSLTEVVTALLGAWRLARFDGRGIHYFDPTMRGFWRSFYAAVLVAPMYALSLRYAADRVPAADPVHAGLAEAIGYVLSWVAFPLLMEGFSRRLGCRSRFPLFITAYNWASVIEHALLMPVLLLTTTGAIPAGLGQALWLGLIAYILAYAWFVARTGLAVGGGVAAAAIGLDLMLSFIIGIVTRGFGA